MAEVKVAFKNVLDKRAFYRKIEGNSVSGVLWTYAREYCEDPEIYNKFLKEKVVVKFNNKVLPVDDWAATPVVDGDKLLVTPALEGDNMAAIIGMVIGAIIIIFAPYLAPLIGTTYASLFLIGAAMIVSGLLSILFAPDLPTFSPLSSKSGGQTYSWSGIKTQARPDQPVPIVYGKHIVGGNLISIFTERNGASDFLYMLVAMCEGEIAGICTEDNTDNVCTTTDFGNAAYKHPWITLNDQPLQNFNNVEWWYRVGTNMPNAANLPTDPSVQNIIPHFSGSRMQMDDGRQITQDGIVFTTTKEVDMAVVQTRFPSMFDATGGNIIKTSVHYGIQYRVNGTDTWYNYTVSQWTPKVTPQLNGDYYANAYQFRSTSYTEGTEGISSDSTRLLTDQKPDTFHVEVTAAEFANPLRVVDYWTQEMVRANETKSTYDLLIKNVTTGQMWTEHINYWSRLVHDEWNGYRVFRGNLIMNIGPYSVGLGADVNVGDAWLLESDELPNIYWIPIWAKTKTGLWDTRTLDFHTLDNGSGKAKYDIRITRQEPLSADFKIANDSFLKSVIEVVNGDFIYPNTAIIGLRMKATGQLSGGVPNLNVMVKGKKVEVPDHSGSERFEEIYYDDDDSRWEYNGAVRTWDESTYVEEYSNNAMLCLRDLMLNKRYGLGEYIGMSDLSDTNIVSIVKECHKLYVPTEGDYLSWWTAGFDQEFVKHIGDPWGGLYPKTYTVSAASQSIAYTGAYTHYIPLVLDAPLKAGQRYQVSLALTGTTKNVDVDIGVRKLQWGAKYKGYWYQLGSYASPELEDKGNGTHTYDFTAPFGGINRVLLVIKKNGGAADCAGTIDDVSISKIVGSGTARGWRYHTFNGVFDAPQAAFSTLMEFTNSFRVWPSWFEGTFKFIMDKDETPIHTLAISNTSSFSQTWVPLSEVPYRIVGQFTDEDQNYLMNQLSVQSTDNTITKSNEMTIGLKGITNRKRAEREVKFRLAKFANSTHSVNIKCGMDMIHATAGDIINISNDLPSWGHGTRVASWNAGSKYLYLVDPYTVVAGGADTMAQYMDANNNFQTATVNMTGISGGDVIRRLTLKSWPAVPAKDGVAAIGLSTSYVKKFRLLSVNRTTEEEIEINALEHIDTLYSSEPVLKVTQDHETQALDAAVGVPDPPINIEIATLSANEGIGFEIYAEHADMRSQEIIVQFSEVDDDSTFVKIGTIGKGQTTIKYINNKLAMDKTYRFRFTSTGLTGTSPAVFFDVYLPKIVWKVNPVTGMQIKGSSPLIQTWDGLNVTIVWNPVGQNLEQSGMMDHYTIYVYKDSYDPNDQNNNLLRVAYPKKNEYTYTYDMNLEDNGTTFPSSTLVFLITANLINGVESDRSRPFLISNSAPVTPQNLDSDKWMRTVTFKWAPDNSTDFSHWLVKHRLEGNAGSPVGAYGTWEQRRDNSFPRTVTGTEINTYGEETRVFFQIKAVDLYNSSSNVASINRTTQTLNIKTVDIATGAVGSTAITASAITTSKLSTFAVEADKIAANAVTAGKINVASLSAISADIGIVTAGLAKSSDGRLIIDFNNKWIKVFDTAATLRVHLGFIP